MLQTNTMTEAASPRKTGQGAVVRALPRAEAQWDGLQALELIQALQTTLELEKLISLFAQHLQASLGQDQLIYRNPREQLEVTVGKGGRHSCTYRLLVAGHTLGELEVRRGKRFSEHDTVVLEHWLSTLLHPLRNALLYREAVESALRDPLTGVNNRSSLDCSLRREIDLARRHDTPLSMVVIDVDHFKAINDRFGHLIGDCVLRDVAQTIARVVRCTDMVFRYGGEEFVVLLSNATLEGAQRLAERIRRSVESLQGRYGERTIPATISLGIACLEADDDASSLFQRADHAMLEAKKSGRNRVVPHRA